MANKLSAETRAVCKALKVILESAHECIGWAGQTKVSQALNIGKAASSTARELRLPTRSEYIIAELFEALLYREWIRQATEAKREKDDAKLIRR
jgi:hypothetical protein